MTKYIYISIVILFISMVGYIAKLKLDVSSLKLKFQTCKEGMNIQNILAQEQEKQFNNYKIYVENQLQETLKDKELIYKNNIKLSKKDKSFATLNEQYLTIAKHLKKQNDICISGTEYAI